MQRVNWKTNFNFIEEHQLLHVENCKLPFNVGRKSYIMLVEKVVYHAYAYLFRRSSFFPF